ncbi:MAG: hypothetical protein ACJ8EY_06410 [Sphingomicrobium sp.]
MSEAESSSTSVGTGADQGFATQARQKAIDAFGSAREGVSSARQRSADQLNEAPLIALAGGLAAGALIAALLPRTESETKALRPVGKRLTETARAAASAAKDSGTQRLSELGLTTERGSETLRSIFEGFTDAAKSSAQAAVSAARNKE